MWADMFKPHTPDDYDMEQRLLYVALTRASDILIVTYSKENEFIERMGESGDVERITLIGAPTLPLGLPLHNS